MINTISFNENKDTDILTALKLKEKEFAYFSSETKGEQLLIQSEILNAKKVLSNALKTFKNPTLFDQNNLQDDIKFQTIIEEYLILLNVKLEESIKYYKDYRLELEGHSLKVQGANKELLQKISYLYGLEDIYKWVFIENFINNFQILSEETTLNINNTVKQATLPVSRVEAIRNLNYYILSGSDCTIGNILGNNKAPGRLNEINDESIFSVHSVNKNCNLHLEINLNKEETVNFFKIKFNKKSKVKSPQIVSILIYAENTNESLELSTLTSKKDYKELLNESYGTYFTPIKTSKIEVVINQNRNYFSNGIKTYPIDIESIELESVIFQPKGIVKSEVFKIENNVFNLESKVSIFPEKNGCQLTQQLRVDGKFKDSEKGVLLEGNEKTSEYFVSLVKGESLDTIELSEESVYEYKKFIYSFFDAPNYVNINGDYINSKFKLFNNRNTTRKEVVKFNSNFKNNKIYIEIPEDFILDSCIIGNASTPYDILEDENIVNGVIVSKNNVAFNKVRTSTNFTSLQNYIDLENDKNIIENSFKFEMGFEANLTKIPYINGVDEFGNSKIFKELLPVEAVSSGEVVTFKLSKSLDRSKLSGCKLYQYGEIINSNFLLKEEDTEYAFNRVYIGENDIGYIKTSENIVFEGYEIEYYYSDNIVITNSFSFDNIQNRLYFSESFENKTVEITYEKLNINISYLEGTRLYNFNYDDSNKEVEILDELDGNVEIFLPVLKNSISVSEIKNYYSPIISEIKVGGS